MLRTNKKKILYINNFETPLGEMISITDNNYLFFLKFRNQINEIPKFKKFEQGFQTTLKQATTKISLLVEKEIKEYFINPKKIFTIPIFYQGSEFQIQVWNQLLLIKSGMTLSYQELGLKIKKPNAQRAIGNCVGANHFTIIVPCHRVIRSNGQLGGYNGGIERKRWLLDYEKSKEDILQD
ncbi:methylated-DNA--[protein]-cysteine S-methyltransferase [Mesoplasma syrphidae]|uniref:methylated-DNA--[protein]-cysteine S-methyltransferase n=1 Tax=Mesoplasma syrphidae TaxID=225999 RepID=A0A2K9BVN4_9MOLU|nr:methylated-DNA--[protein]-cysteine S-methyltransferase [Mesoplasma syrphidae]AUF83780.1 methylated-DNA--[protein]-cysteine S-methyltransferase [Mesoplasma syrphidae]